MRNPARNKQILSAVLRTSPKKATQGRFKIYNIALPKKFSRTKLKYTDADFVPKCLGIPKIYAACLSDVSPNGKNFLKLARGPLKSQIDAHEFSRLTQYFRLSKKMFAEIFL